jgi:hypothetical protein
MRIFAGMLIAFCLTPLYLAAQFNPFNGRMPIAVFIQSNPWAMVIGADTPRVAVYENGEVVFVKKLKNRQVYHHVVLDKRALAQLRARLHSVLAQRSLKPSYSLAPNVTDQPEAKFYIRDDGREVATSVYGLVASGTKVSAHTTFPNGPKSVAPPEELLQLHKWFCGLDYPASKEWTPKYVEVMLWDYSYAPEQSIKWPKEWPALTSDRAIQHGDFYSVFLDGALLPKLQRFLGTQKEKGAVDVNGKKMSASYRYTFPSEPTWRNAFVAAERAAGNGGG